METKTSEPLVKNSPASQLFQSNVVGTTESQSTVTQPNSSNFKLDYGISLSQAAGHQATADITQFSLFGASNINSESQVPKESSLFARGQMTKGISNLSSLQDAQKKTAVSTQAVVSFQTTITSTPAGTQQQQPGTKKDHSQKTVSSKTSSSSSIQSWPDPIQNMHTGKPAYATENDPFGSKHAAYRSSIKRSSVESRGYKPLHGRRAGNSLFTKDEPEESLSGELEIISENHPGSKSPSNLNFKPRQESESYPWEVSIDVQGREPDAITKTRDLGGRHKKATRGESTNSSDKRPLLPLRPKRTSFEMAMGESMPGSIGVQEPDDLEEVIL